MLGPGPHQNGSVVAQDRLVTQPQRISGLTRAGEALARDVRHAFRALRRTPLFTIVVVACLALGIATNTTMFSVFHAIALRALPFTHPEQLVSLYEREPGTGRRATLSWTAFTDWRSNAHAFTEMAAHTSRVLVLTEGEDPERVAGRLVSAGFFPLLGAQAQIGRLFDASDDAPGAPHVVLLSDALWRRRFGGQRSITGRAISLNNVSYTVAGVLEPGFAYPGSTELWIPLAPELAADRRDVRGLSTIARLKPGISVQQATREVTELARRLHRAYRSASDAQDTLWMGEARSLQGSITGSDERIVAAAMLGATTFLLLIACANVANLLLTRAIGRQREIAVRAAIGAGRHRIARQLITEAVLLAVLACVVALPVIRQALRWIAAAIPPSDAFPYYVHWSLDLPTFCYAALASLATGILFGLGPALLAARVPLQEALRTGTQGSGSGPRQHRLRHTMVVAEVALALVLLVGAALFVRTWVGIRATELGYDTSRIMTMRFYLPGARYDSAGPRTRVVADIARRMQALPGVEAAAVSDLIPLDDEGGAEGEITIEGDAGDTRRSIAYCGVTGDWFGTLGLTLVSGRAFSEQETRDSVPVAVINRVMARQFWPGRNALGQRFRLAGDATRTWFTVIGVAPDIRTVKLDENRRTPPTVYLPYRFTPTRDYGVLLRTRALPAAITGEARTALHAADPSLPLFNVWTMDEVRYLSYWMYVLWGLLFGSFGISALVLAALGVYAVIYYSVAQRTREIGARVALGAQRADILRLVLGQGLALASTGVAIGLAGALALTRVVGSLLIGVSATDPLSFLGVALFLTATALLASYLPALRATRVDPLEALRQE